jgi:hypothetical protein
MEINRITAVNQSILERRKYPRKEMFLVMEVEEHRQSNRRLSVITSNISAGGVYFKAQCCERFMMGTETNLSIFLSTPSSSGKPFMSRISGKGKVVRREEPAKNDFGDRAHDPDWIGIAVQFDEALIMC